MWPVLSWLTYSLFTFNCWHTDPHIVASVVDSRSFLHCVPQTKKLSIHSLKLLVNNLMFTKTWKDFVFCVGDTSTRFALLLPFLLLSYVCVWFAMCVWMLTLYRHMFYVNMSAHVHMCIAGLGLTLGRLSWSLSCLIHLGSFQLNPGLTYSSSPESLL